MTTCVPATVRMATRADVSRLVDLALQFLAAPEFVDVLGPADPARVFAFVYRIVTADDSVTFVAMDGERIIGMIGAGLYQHQLTGRLTGKEVGLYVEPSARGRTAARELLAEAEAWACGAGAVVFEVQGPSQAVGRFYERRGYRCYELGYVRRLPC